MSYLDDVTVKINSFCYLHKVRYIRQYQNFFVNSGCGALSFSSIQSLKREFGEDIASATDISTKWKRC